MMRNKFGALLVTAAVASLTVVSLSGVASAGAPQPVPKATGSIVLSDPLQYVSFDAFATTPVKGSVTYTNFEAAAPGSGSWVLENSLPLVFDYGGLYPWTVAIDPISPTGNSSFTFVGTATFDGGGGYVADVTGSVSGTAVTFHMLYTGTDAGFYLHATGTINPDGSVAGTSTDSWGRILPWTMAAGSASEVLMYTAPVTAVTVAAPNASFSYVIPSGNPYSGIAVTMDMTDGGSPGAVFDTFKIFGGGYTITAGNLVVHS